MNIVSLKRAAVKLAITADLVLHFSDEEENQEADE